VRDRQNGCDLRLVDLQMRR